MINPPLWKASVALTKAEAADSPSALELDGSAQAVLIAEEPFADGAVVEALYTEEPDAAYLSRIAGRTITVAPLPDQDWISLSQEGLPPVRAGRFFVYGAHDAGTVPHGVIPIRIEAGLAFGTGHHETTALCLARAERHRHAARASAMCWTWAAAPACWPSARPSCGSAGCWRPTSIPSPSRSRARMPAPMARRRWSPPSPPTA